MRDNEGGGAQPPAEPPVEPSSPPVERLPIDREPIGTVPFERGEAPGDTGYRVSADRDPIETVTLSEGEKGSPGGQDA